MSAGGLSYSGITNYGVVSLPSVESWGTNMNILRDPPKSIMTRRKDKVGETSSITEMIDASGDRAAEVIKVYPRGVNPSVSVSYSNTGGNHSGSITGLSQNFSTLSGVTSGAQAIQPHRIMMYDGNFRPPLSRLSPTELMPLSRQPRVWTSQYTSPEKIDYSKTSPVRGGAGDMKEVHTEKLNTWVAPTLRRDIKKPLEAPNEVKYSIQNIMNLQANAGMRTRDLTQTQVKKPHSGIVDNILESMAFTNLNDNKKYIENNNFLTKRFIQDTLHQDVSPNISYNKQNTVGETSQMETQNFIQDTLHQDVSPNISYNKQNTVGETSQMETQNFIQDTLHQDVSPNISYNKQNTVGETSQMETQNFIQDTNNIDYRTPEILTGDGTNYIHDDLILNKNLPSYDFNTNITDSRTYKYVSPQNEIRLEKNTPQTYIENNINIGRTQTPQSREKQLIPKINPGSYNGQANKPLQNRIQQIPQLKQTNKHRIQQVMYNNNN